MVRTPAPDIRLDLACFSLADRRLVVLARSPEERAEELPSARLGGSPELSDAASALASEVLGAPPTWITQLGAYPDPGSPEVSVSIAYLAIVPAGTNAPTGHQWVATESRQKLGLLQRRIVGDGAAMIRERMHTTPLAFRLLPARFTLPQLQDVYEVLLGRRLHKASFRRALLAAALVVPTDESTSEGRGRPALLYRYAPRKGGPRTRPARFDLLR